MKRIPIILLALFVSSCHFSDQSVHEAGSNLEIDSGRRANGPVELPDTSTLEGKRAIILNRFQTEGEIPRHVDFDTLIDLTYDGGKDYVIGYYGQSGTGIKNRIEVFLFNRQTGSYQFDSLLSDLPNLSFYPEKKKLTSFYIGNGGGGGDQLEFINNKWTETKSFTVDKQDSDAVWVITLPLEHKTRILRRPFQMFPPSDILESKFSE